MKNLLTDKTLKAFEEWYEKDYFADKNRVLPSNFNLLTDSMQYGVIVDFFDSVGINIEIVWRFDLGYGFILIDKNGYKTHGYYDVIFNSICEAIFWDTRPEARRSAVEKANELFNQMD